MLIIARPARLLECLEFDPEDFYNQMVDMEGEMRTMQMIRRMNQYGQQSLQQPQVEAPTLSVQDTGESMTDLFLTVSTIVLVFLTIE